MFSASSISVKCLACLFGFMSEAVQGQTRTLKTNANAVISFTDKQGLKKIESGETKIIRLLAQNPKLLVVVSEHTAKSTSTDEAKRQLDELLLVDTKQPFDAPPGMIGAEVVRFIPYDDKPVEQVQRIRIYSKEDGSWDVTISVYAECPRTTELKICSTADAVFKTIFNSMVVTAP